MFQSFTTLRVTLTLVITAHLAGAYVFFFAPELVAPAYAGSVHLALILGVLLLVLAVGAFLAILNPVKNASIVTMLIISHFAVFILDVVLLARGLDLPLEYTIPEMAYLLMVCALLIRSFPTPMRAQDLDHTANALMKVVKKNLKKEKTEQSNLEEATSEETA